MANDWRSGELGLNRQWVEERRRTCCCTAPLRPPSSVDHLFNPTRATSAHFATNIVFSVNAAQPIGATLIACTYLPIELLSSQDIERHPDILDASRKRISYGSTIHVQLQFHV
uniref:Uncharacterized protein n=1 Tax=Oryza sativa subsp. japonica TaxID=39947 RepID=Q654T0_ORYSJ|nr:hypothetical protein [Oryza sativa Japonica Group]